MKKKIFFISLGVICIALLSYSFYPTVNSKTRSQVLIQLVTASLNSAHYEPVKYNNDFSQKFYKLYLDRLDPQKKFFLKEDISLFEKYKLEIDEQVYNGDFTFFDLVNDTYNKRVASCETYYKEILSSPMNFNDDESFETDVEKSNFSGNADEQKNVWRKYLKFQVLFNMYDAIKIQDKAIEKKDTLIKQKSREQIEEESRKKVMKDNDDLFSRLKRLTYADRLSMYINTVTNLYDPHTEYYPAKDKENFDIRMSGQLEGIGAQLQEKEGYIKVSRIVPGSPSWRQGELKAGDVILKVAQGKEEPIDIVGMDIDDAVKLIRGKKGTIVNLTVKKQDGAIKVISITRDVVVLEDTFAKSAVINANTKIGYIKLPSFYADFENKSGRSCSKDVKEELLKLKKENLEALIFDLRDNGGGSLQDVVTMTGLFIEQGPIVQVKQKSGSPRVLKDYDSEVVYDGPLVVLINENSASASEIFAAAIQDYGRGVIVGSTSSFGKGTVQQFINLDDYVMPQFDTLKPIGSVKLTIQKFYRVNGGSTQLKGVVPDVVLPDLYKYYEYGEKELEFPMKWDQIEPLEITKWKSINLESIKKSSAERVSKNEQFKLIDENAKRLKSQREQSVVSLNLEKYIQYRKKLEEDQKKYELLNKENEFFKAYVLMNEPTEKDSARAASDKDFIGRIRKDIYLLEASNIIGDIK